MGFLIKSFLVLLLIVVTGGYLINRIPSWKERAIEIINPAAKEARLLGKLTASLEELDKKIEDNKNKDLLNKSRGILQNITDLNQKNSGVIKQQVGKIIDAFIDRTPYPADHVSLIANNPTPPVCPPSQ